MPGRSKGPRLYLRKARPGQRAVWVILDTLQGRYEKSTGFGPGDIAGAEAALGKYIARKHFSRIKQDSRDPAHIPIADAIVLRHACYKVSKQARPKEVAQRLGLLMEFFGDKMLGEVNGALRRRCRTKRRQRTPASFGGPSRA